MRCMNCRIETIKPGTSYVNEMIYPLPVSVPNIRLRYQHLTLPEIYVEEHTGAESVLFTGVESYSGEGDYKPGLVQ